MPVLLQEVGRPICGNLTALGAAVLVIGVTNRDEAGSVLVDLLLACSKLNTDHLVIDASRPLHRPVRLLVSPRMTAWGGIGSRRRQHKRMAAVGPTAALPSSLLAAALFELMRTHDLEGIVAYSTGRGNGRRSAGWQ